MTYGIIDICKKDISIIIIPFEIMSPTQLGELSEVDQFHGSISKLAKKCKFVYLALSYQ